MTTGGPAVGTMRRRRLGRTGLQVSTVGFGTCQLRLVPRAQAVATLLKGFELGVDLVHTAPDYEGAEDLVAEAVRESGRNVIVASQGYGDAATFERLFESTCERLGRERLDLFGVACADDREALGENLWGPGGQVEFLLRKKEEGRLGGLFCTTHGTPEYIRGLLERDAFDAIMLAYNPLGFHLLTYNPPKGGRGFESVPANLELFDEIRRRDVGLLVMKPLAGGLLCSSLAFPPRVELRPAGTALRAGDVLRTILGHEAVAAVVPGTASVAEAEENARAGHDDPAALPAARRQAVAARVAELQSTLCSRCGRCDDLCSRSLPVSFLFRSSYISAYPSETFETPPQYEYFRLQPQPQATCASCTDVTCACPYGIDIPRSLMRLHEHMGAIAADGGVPPAGHPLDQPAGTAWAARLVHVSMPAEAAAGVPVRVALQVANVGGEPWLMGSAAYPRPRVALRVDVDGREALWETLREHVSPGCRGHFAFELPPLAAGLRRVRLTLASQTADGPPPPEIALHDATLRVAGAGGIERTRPFWRRLREALGV
jgi:predicted aldo/keto reductase-like oxidoreductase